MLKCKIIWTLVYSFLSMINTDSTYDKHDLIVRNRFTGNSFVDLVQKESYEDSLSDLSKNYTNKSNDFMLSISNSPITSLSNISKAEIVSVISEKDNKAEISEQMVAATATSVSEQTATEVPVAEVAAETVPVVTEPALVVTDPVPSLIVPETPTETVVVEPQEPVVTEQNIVSEIDDSDITCSGIDVSKWQGTIDWNRIKNAGVQFAMIKAGEGTTVESKFYENLNGAKAAGINCGVYWFSHAGSIEEAEAEAQACLDAIAGYQLEYPVVCDFEYRSRNNNPIADDKTKLTDAIRAFLCKIQQNGYYSMFYTNSDFSQRYLEFERISCDFDIWCAGYSVPEPTMPCGMWQYSETGVVDGTDIYGLNGANNFVDLDISYKNYPAKMKKYHLNGY